MIEVNPQPVYIGSVWYYQKINCLTSERYISVKEYKKRYGVDLRKINSCKPLVVYDKQEKVSYVFKSFTEASKHLKINMRTIWEVTHTPNRIVKNRYKFNFNEIKEEKENKWEYSNTNFNEKT